MLEKINDTADVNLRNVEEIIASTEYLNKMTDALNQKLRQFTT